jgi:hypothetical protein
MPGICSISLTTVVTRPEATSNRLSHLFAWADRPLPAVKIRAELSGAQLRYLGLSRAAPAKSLVRPVSTSSNHSVSPSARTDAPSRPDQKST